LENIDLDEGIRIALDALFEDRLAAICGAGLSMASPSSIPSAWDVAEKAKLKYDSMYGATEPPLSENIEEQAEFFRNRGQLGSMYLRSLVDRHIFSAPSNLGHFAIADLLLTSALKLVLSTNVDALIEQAGDKLYGGIAVATDRDGAASFPNTDSVLLKIHGCWKKDLEQTVWAPGQLNDIPFSTRIPECAEWLSTQLLNRDILIVGYFTDWDYLNSVLETSLEAVNVGNVIVVDTSPPESLLTKAPSLHEFCENSANRFVHVQMSGDDFLDTLRKRWSSQYLRRILFSGYNTMIELGEDIEEDLREPPDLDTQSLWFHRRDLEGCSPTEPCTKKVPNNEPVLGYHILKLRMAGATVDGRYWNIAGQTIRVLNSSSMALHQVEKIFKGDVSSVTGPDVTIASGATNLNMHANISRPVGSGTIVRPEAKKFMTFDEAVLELNL